MIPAKIPACYECRRFRSAVSPDKWAWSCDAFPEGIPPEISSARNDHTEPVSDDRGLLFSKGPNPWNREII
jgi:hypothetical protein